MSANEEERLPRGPTAQQHRDEKEQQVWIAFMAAEMGRSNEDTEVIAEIADEALAEFRKRWP